MTRVLSAALVPQPTTRLPGSRIGIGFNSTAYTALKIAVLAPIANASVATAARV